MNDARFKVTIIDTSTGRPAAAIVDPGAASMAANAIAYGGSTTLMQHGGYSISGPVIKIEAVMDVPDDETYDTTKELM